MKRIVISGIIIFAIIFGVLIFVNDEKSDEKNVTKIGLILNGSKDDRGYSQAHYEGIKALEKKMDVRVYCKENVPLDKSCEKSINELVEKKKCNIIFCNSYGYGEYEKKIADKNPDVYFYHATGADTGDNFASYFGRMYQIRYLSGIVAGLQTKNDSIGYIAAIPIDEVVRGINAFTLGVQSVNPSAVVHVEWTNNWTDGNEAKKAVDKLADDHNIDVVTHHVDILDALDEAEKKGIYTIGYNMDNSDRYPNTYLTSCVWNWKNFYEEQVNACIEGKFKGEHYWLGSETGVMELSKFTDNVRPGIAQEVEKAQNKIEEGSTDVFYGPIYDNKGKLRVAEGESMSDDELLNSFDWFVKGVDTKNE